jgi:hypothetical protein
VAINRSQGLVLGFLAATVLALLAIFAYAPFVYTGVLHPALGQTPAGEIAFLTALLVFIGFVGFGVVRRWRWMFWLIVIAFLAGSLRVPASALELMRVVPIQGPSWYIAFQGVVGVIQVGIAVALLIGYRKAGVWGPF